MNHTYVSDFFALGVIAYEMTSGKVKYAIICRDHTMAILVTKYVSKYYPNKYRSRLQKFLKTGLLNA